MSRLIIISMILWTAHAFPANAALRITELSAAGRQGLTDEEGDTPDWIELQNTGPEPLDLSGWVLTREAPGRREWVVPATTLPTGAFMVLFASGKNRADGLKHLHTNFKLRGEGGAITLRYPKGDYTDRIDYPRQLPGISFGLPDRATHSSSNYTYLHSSTPGRSNSAAVSSGPHIVSLSHRPVVPRASEPVLVRAQVLPGAGFKVTLRYRVMFEREAVLEMRDDGEHGDGSEGDGVFGATIPSGLGDPGQMIRYCVVVEDRSGGTSRWPLFANRAGYSSYQGFVVSGPAIQSRLPVIELFDRRSLQTQQSSGASLFFDGEFYDNVRFAPHGQISRSFPKPSFNLEFPYDHHFRYASNQARVSDVKLLGNFADKSKIRNTLAYEMISAAGSIGHFAFPARIQVNGEFFCIAELIEDGDDRWLERVGLDPVGALYKIYSPLGEHLDAEKKTRKRQNSRDLNTFVDAISEERPLPERVGYAYENINIPQCISYLVAMALISSGDHGHKNYYLYRDTRETGEWLLLPWDVDLSWGRNWTGRYFDDRIYVDNPLSLHRAGGKDRGRNPIYNIFFEHPPFRQMYHRRLRSVMDELLRPPGAPSSSSPIENRIRELIDLLDPEEFSDSDAELDTARWPGWGPRRGARVEAQRILDVYVPGRRDFLYRRATLHGDRIPESQPANAAIQIERVNHTPDKGDQFICLTNRNRFAIDLSGWKLSGAGIEFQFRPGTVLPPSEVLYLVSDVRSFRRNPRRGAQEKPIFTQGNWTGALVSIGTIFLNDASGREVDSHTLKLD